MSARRAARWRALAACATGRKHQQRGEPGQDAVFAGSGHGRAAIVVCDGAGSARLAREGAEAMAMGMGRFLLRRGRFLLRDGARPGGGTVARAIRAEIERILMRTMRRYRCARRDLATTLLLGLAGKHGTLIAQVGDGAIVLLRDGGPPQAAATATRGEFAGETVFVTSRSPEAAPVVSWQPGIHALVAMSDGGEGALITRSTGTPAPAVATLAQWVATQPRRRASRALHVAVGETLVQQGWDDVAVAILARRRGR